MKTDLLYRFGSDYKTDTTKVTSNLLHDGETAFCGATIGVPTGLHKIAFTKCHSCASICQSHNGECFLSWLLRLLPSSSSRKKMLVIEIARMLPRSSRIFWCYAFSWIHLHISVNVLVRNSSNQSPSSSHVRPSSVSSRASQCFRSPTYR